MRSLGYLVGLVLGAFFSILLDLKWLVLGFFFRGVGGMVVFGARLRHQRRNPARHLPWWIPRHRLQRARPLPCRATLGMGA